MSTDAFIDAINASGARFLIASLGAQKGQSWLLRNHHRLRIPVRSHLGAALNFQAGRLRRAPLLVRRFGLEWLWRIKEEPHLWRRYFRDGLVLVRLMLTSVLPLALGAWWRGVVNEDRGLDVSCEGDQLRTIKLAGHAVERHVAKLIPIFRDSIGKGSLLTIDVSGVRAIDPRFLGLLLIARKQMAARGGRLQIWGASSRLRRAFRLNRFDFLLNPGPATDLQQGWAAAAFARSEVAMEVSSAPGNA
jgi:N-acetylglucosaminyldiphosphoundecaprenol N-acetyl-beta-D-mannosaminyltransferase